MFIPKISQVPIQQSMYVNGIMHQVWIDFFERLASLLNTSDLSDLIELQQKVAELPSQAIQGQQGFDISLLLNQFQLSTVVQNPQCNTFDSVPIPNMKTYELPPVQAVFLCPEQSISLALVPSGEIIHD